VSRFLPLRLAPLLEPLIQLVQGFKGWCVVPQAVFSDTHCS